jgi:hypothetical protein
LQGDEFIGISVGAEGGRDVVEHVHACDLQFELLEGEVGQAGVVLAWEFLGLGLVALVLTRVLASHERRIYNYIASLGKTQGNA